MARIGITLGDVAGIGPEIVIKALDRIPRELNNLTIIGPLSILRATQMMLSRTFTLPRVVDTGNFEFEYGKVQQHAGEAALAALVKGIEFIKNGAIDALVTCPVSKQAVQMSFPSFRGHTEYLAQALGVTDVLMIAHSPYASFAFVTTHLSLSSVSESITAEQVYKKLRLYNDFLAFYHSRPVKIGVTALNPHAEEFSEGEEKFIAQAIAGARNEGIDACGPFPADTIHLNIQNFDGFLVQYHDQGMIPAKFLASGEGVNITWGLPFVRTSPLHGTAFDIAGKDKADPSSMLAAIRMAEKLVRN
ncbi:4-hydroxythreonine-4-phosphate dehydrogenase PdxA [bacterium]|nr:4-hydroxythreonine-4-phosphate dehydrogenase PdxA [bacterium]